MILVFLDVSPSCWPVGRPGHLCQPSWPAGVQGFQDPGAGFLSATLLRLLRKWNCAVIYGPGQRGQWTPHAHPSQARPKVEVTSSGASERAWSGAFSHVSRSRAIWTLGVQSGCWEGLKARFLSSVCSEVPPVLGQGTFLAVAPWCRDVKKQGSSLPQVHTPVPFHRLGGISCSVWVAGWGLCRRLCGWCV